MKPTAVPRALTALAHPLQDEVFAWMTKGGTDFARRRVLERFQASVSKKGMGVFYAWYHIDRNLLSASSCGKAFEQSLAALAGAQPGPSEMNGQQVFEEKAMQDLNSALFIGMRQLRQKDRAIALTMRRVLLLEQQASLTEEEEPPATEKRLTEEEQDSKMREFFGLPEPEANPAPSEAGKEA